MTALSNETLDELLAAAGKATPGPWDVVDGTDTTPPQIVSRDVDADDTGRAVYYRTEVATVGDTADEEANAAFIALANPATLTALITELQSYRTGGAK